MCTIYTHDNTKTVEINLQVNDNTLDLSKVHKGYKCILYGDEILNNVNLKNFLLDIKKICTDVDLFINQEDIKNNTIFLKNLVSNFLVDRISVNIINSHEKEDLKFIDLLGDKGVVNIIADLVTKHDLVALTGRNVRFFGAAKNITLNIDQKERDKHINWLKKHMPILKNMCKNIEFYDSYPN